MGSKNDKNFYKKPFVGVPREILNSYAYLALNFSARSLYLEIRLRMNSFNNGNINASLASLRDYGWTSSATLAKCLKQLESVGLIKKTRQTVGVENGSKMCNLFCFTDLPINEHSKFGIPASRETNDFLFIKSAREAKELVNASILKKRTLQILNQNESKTEGSTVVIDSDIEVQHCCDTSFSEGWKASYSGKNVSASSTYDHQSNAV